MKIIREIWNVGRSVRQAAWTEYNVKCQGKKVWEVGMGCNDSKLKGSKRNNNESHCVIIDWILFPKIFLKGPKTFFETIGKI